MPSIERLKPDYRRLILAAIAAALLLSCRLFEYSPYVIPQGDNGEARLAHALSRIARSDGPGRGFSFAVFADIQSAYDDLKACVRRVNADSSIRFVIVAGDLTQYGLLREFEWVRDGLDGLKPPYLPLIGNHDALANGTEIFRRLFGPLDYSFVYRETKFVLFNDNVWEFEGHVPDLARLEAELEAPDSLRLIPVAHIPPWGDQSNPDMDSALTEMFARHRTTLCIYAHTHNFHLQTDVRARRPYLVADNIAGRNYAKVTMAESTFTVERIFF